MKNLSKVKPLSTFEKIDCTGGNIPGPSTLPYATVYKVYKFNKTLLKAGLLVSGNICHKISDLF